MTIQIKYYREGGLILKPYKFGDLSDGSIQSQNTLEPYALGQGPEQRGGQRKVSSRTKSILIQKIVMVFHSLKTCKARLTARPHTFLDNERPSLAIYIGIRRIGCHIFIQHPHFSSLAPSANHLQIYSNYTTLRHPM